MNVEMTAASVPAAPRPAARRGVGAAILGAGRLLRIELRHNAMLWLLPVAIALFWYNGYREIMALPPMWNLRAMTLQNRLLLDLAIPVAGAAAWMGSREGRRNITDLVAVTARPHWSRQLAIWAATTAWAEVACLACVAVVYVMTARQASWGGPLVPVAYQQGPGNSLVTVTAKPGVSAFAVPDQVPGQPGATSAGFAGQLSQSVGLQLVSHVILGGGQAAANPGQAQLAVIAGSVRFPSSVESRDLAPLYGSLLPEPGSPADLAARRFAALSPAARHAWLAQHLAALQAGRISLAQLP